ATTRWKRWTTSPRSWTAGSGRPSRARARTGRMRPGHRRRRGTRRRTDMTADMATTTRHAETTRTLYGHLTDWAAQTPDRVLVTQLDPARDDAANGDGGQPDLAAQLTAATAAQLHARAG